MASGGPSGSAGIVNLNDPRIADSINWQGSDYSNPEASSSATAKYKTGNLYNMSGGSAGLGLGKLVLIGLFALAGYSVYKRYK